MSGIAHLGVLAGTAGAAVSPRVVLLLGAGAIVALLACGTVPLARAAARARRARRRPRPVTGPVVVLTAGEAQAWDGIVRRLKADGKRRTAPRRRRPARRTRQRAGKR